MPDSNRKPVRRYHLSKAGRAALVAAAFRNRPWQYSTGPRTPDGRLVSGQNALKHGYYCRQPLLDDAAGFRAFVRSIQRASRAGKRAATGPPIVD